jgi:hypothetical protein
LTEEKLENIGARLELLPKKSLVKLESKLMFRSPWQEQPQNY